MLVEESVDLIRHPLAEGDPIRRIQCHVRRTETALEVAYRAEGDISRVRLPRAASPRIVAGLWQHTCFEAFVAMEDRPGYHEFNFATSTEWAAYVFRAYREGAILDDLSLEPAITTRAHDDRMELGATIPLARLSSEHARAPLRIGLSTVIEDECGACWYWALHHPVGAPDFHHADARTVLLEPLRPEW